MSDLVHFKLFEGDSFPRSACNLSHPKLKTRDVASVTCPSCQDWLNKNINIRTAQLKRKQDPSV